MILMFVHLWLQDSYAYKQHLLMSVSEAESKNRGKNLGADSCCFAAETNTIL